tara:strand:+ start:42 stop:1127 length:1086 start_codon:yes stop_codon:yes gene_type:complete
MKEKKEKNYQERMTEKYGDAKTSYNKCNPRYLKKEHLEICKNNTIRIKENIAINYWDYTKPVIKEIELDGEIYTKVIKEKENKEFFMYYEQNERDYYEYNFELLDLKYKFFHDWYGHKGHFSPCLYVHPDSSNRYVNYVTHLFEWGFLDSKILDVQIGKFTDDGFIHKDTLKENIENNNAENVEMRILLQKYGWNNSVRYKISLDTFFKIDYKKIKKYAYDYIKFFKNIGLDLKHTTYEERIYWQQRLVINIRDAKKGIELMKKYEHLFVEETTKTEYVRPQSKCYILKDNNTGFYKIGKSINPVFREKTLQSEKPTIQAVKIFKEDHEDELHKKYSKYRVRGEWFKLNKIQLQYICSSYA